MIASRIVPVRSAANAPGFAEDRLRLSKADRRLPRQGGPGTL